MPQQDSDTTRCSTTSQDTPAPSVDGLRYEVFRVCRDTDVADLVAAFIDYEDAEDFAFEVVETDQFDFLIRDTSNTDPSPKTTPPAQSAES